jgi:hypothetical protein
MEEKMGVRVGAQVERWRWKVEGEREGERGRVRVGRADGKWQARQTETCMQATMSRHATNGRRAGGVLTSGICGKCCAGVERVLPTAVESGSVRLGSLQNWRPQLEAVQSVCWRESQGSMRWRSGEGEGMEETGWERVVYMDTPLAPYHRVIVGGVFEVR